MRISADCIDQEVAVKNPQTNDTHNNNPRSTAASSSIIQEAEPAAQQQSKTTQVSGKQSNNSTAMESGRHIGVVVQKDDAKNTRRNTRKTIKIPFPDATIPWCCFKSRLLQACNIKPGSDVEILYLDEEEDKIHINSEDEFFEAMRVAEHMNPFIIFVKEMDSAMRANKLGSDARKPRSFTVISDACTCDSDSENDDDFQQNDLNSSLSNFDTSTPPVWFEAYMKTMEANIVSKISQEMEQMMTTVLQILKQDEKKKTEKQTFESAEKVEGPLHAGIVCDNCERLIRGIRYKCEVCEDFDLCMKCEAIPGVHTKGHMFLKITEPVQTRTIRCIPFFRPKQANASCAVNQSDDQQAAANAQPPLFPMTKTEPSMTYGFRSGKNERKMAKMMKKIAKRSVSHPLQIKVRSSSSSALPGQEAWTAGRRNTDPNIEKDGCRISFPPFMDAQFIDDGNVPDGKVMQPGERFVKCWKVCNSGTKRWNSHTVLRCWGSSGLIPKSKEVAVPHLRPGEEGIISVHFLAPSKPGRYQSHWRFYHRNNVFGHHLWCNIEVASPAAVLQGPPATAPPKNVSSEKEADQLLEAVPPAPVLNKMNKKPTEVTEDIAQALSVVQVEQENGQLGGRKKVLISHTTTPTNTPFDMTPPKSPEPHPKEQHKPSTPVDKLDLTAADKAADVSSDGEDTASVLSLSSSDSDTEFVVIPVPSSTFSMVPQQFNKSPTAIASDQLSCSQFSLTSTDTFEMVRRKNSSGSGNGEEDTFKKSTVSEHPASSSTSSDITTAESSGGEECLTRADAVPACLAASAATAELPSTEDERLSVTDDVKCGLDGGGRTAKDSPPEKGLDNAVAVGSQEQSGGSTIAAPAPVTPAVTTATTVEVSMPSGAVSESGPTQPAVASSSTKSSAVSNINPQAYTQAVLNQQSARTIDVLPEGLMTGALSAAATVYNTTRELFSSIQRQTEPSAEIIHFLQPGTYYTAPVWSPPPPPPPPPPPTDTPMGHLVEMGFCNVALNESLLEKHKGNLSEVVAELIATSDNDWFTHRHRPEPTINFD